MGTVDDTHGLSIVEELANLVFFLLNGFAVRFDGSFSDFHLLLQLLDTNLNRPECEECISV